MVILRDGRKLQGVFRSYDQYGELALWCREIVLTLLPFSISLSCLHQRLFPTCHTPFYHSLKRFLRILPQIANFLLESTIERLHYRLEYADRDIGKLTIHHLRRDS